MFAAICEACRTFCDNANALVLAGPAFLGAVVGFASSDTPGSSSSSVSNTPVTSGTFSVAVEAVAFGTVSVGGSMARPVVFRPPRLGTGGDLAAFALVRGGGGVRFPLFQLLRLLPGDLRLPRGLRAIVDVVDRHW